MNRIYLICVLLVASLLGASAAGDTGIITLYGMQNYTVTSISPNGKWAAGYFTDSGGAQHAFRWNLSTDRCELLTGSTEVSNAFGVSDDGIVSGCYPDDRYTSNGATVTTCGYYSGGRWRALEPISGFGAATHTEYDGQAYCVSEGAHLIGGGIYDANGKWKATVWKDGKVHKVLEGTEGCVYDISADGTKAAGWAYKPGGKSSRLAVLWDIETGAATYLNETGSPFHVAQKFSSDGKHLLHDTGIYNVETGENTDIGSLSTMPYSLQYMCMDDNLTVYAYEQDMMTYTSYGSVYTGGKFVKLDTYLAEKGVDLSNLPVVSALTVTATSADGKVLAISTMDKNRTEHPVVVLLDQNVGNREPVGLAVVQLDGLMGTRLSWQKPLGATSEPTGYNVYRNGIKLMAQPLAGTTSYIDTGLGSGMYSYAVTAVYGTAESAKSEAASLWLSEPTPSAPRMLTGRQKGFNSVSIMWSRPATNLVSKGYYDTEADLLGFGGGANSFEFAIKYDKAEMGAYGGYTISKVAFVPRTAQKAWELKIYDGGKLVCSQPITQQLDYGVENIVALDKPVAVSSLTGDVMCAIAVTVDDSQANTNVVGMDQGNCVPGYSDLVHLSTESGFYSLSDSSKANGYQFDISFALSMVLSKEGDTAGIDDVKQYSVYADGALVGTSTTTSYVDRGVADGHYIYTVEAEYADGRVSQGPGVSVDVAADKSRLKPVDNVDCWGDNRTVAFSWQEPKDDDEQAVGYCGEEPAQAVEGTSATVYGYRARVVYPAEKLKGLDGYVIRQLRYYPMNSAIFTFMIYKDGELLATVEPDEPVYKRWNTVDLEEPIVIDANSEYTLDLDCFDGLKDQGPLAIDLLPQMYGFGDLVSLDDGVSYASLSSSNGTGNWMMGLVVADPAATTLPIEGYTVRLDGEDVATLGVSETSYEHDFGLSADENAERSVAVVVDYGTYGKVEGKPNAFTLGGVADGIDDAVVADLSVYPNPATDYVTVEGAGVSSLAAYSLGGALMGKADGNRLDVSSYAPGLYILKVSAGGEEHTVKLTVVR